MGPVYAVFAVVIIALFFLTIWAAMGIDAAEAQEAGLVPVTSCLSGGQNFGKWGRIHGRLIEWPGYPTPEEEATWNTCYGPALPDDIHLRQWLMFGARWLAILDAESEPEKYWVMAFDTIEPSAGANGEHWGIHPCGLYEVDAPPSSLPRDYYMN